MSGPLEEIYDLANEGFNIFAQWSGSVIVRTI